MQTPESTEGHDLRVACWFGAGPAVGRVFLQTQMSSVDVVRVDNPTPIILNREKSVTLGILGMLAL